MLSVLSSTLGISRSNKGCGDCCWLNGWSAREFERYLNRYMYFLGRYFRFIVPWWSTSNHYIMATPFASALCLLSPEWYQNVQRWSVKSYLPLHWASLIWECCLAGSATGTVGAAWAIHPWRYTVQIANAPHHSILSKTIIQGQDSTACKSTVGWAENISILLRIVLVLEYV